MNRASRYWLRIKELELLLTKVERYAVVWAHSEVPQLRAAGEELKKALEESRKTGSKVA